MSEASPMKAMLDGVRNVLSTILTLACLVIIVYAIANGHAKLPGHPIILYCIFVFVVTLLGFLEGLQIAILVLEKVNRELFAHNTKAYNNHKLATRDEGLNVQRFLIGRQFFVVFVVFLSAQLTTYPTLELPLPSWLFTFLIETGLPGCLVVLAFGQLMPQLVASTHPITMMGLPFSWATIQMALMFETLGVTHFSWVLTFIVKHMFRMSAGDQFTIRQSQTKSRTKGNSRSSKSRSKKGGEADAKKIQKPELFDSFIDDDSMAVNVMDVDSLYSNAECGLSAAGPDDMAHTETLKWLRDDSTKNVFSSWGHSAKNTLPQKRDIVRHLVRTGQPVPRYLLPKHHPHHIPAHIVVLALIRREEERVNQHENKGDEA
jgi:hypothetical protein